MIKSFYDDFKPKNPKALYLLHLYIELKLKKTSYSSMQSIVTLDYDHIDTEEHFSVMKMISNPSKEFLATCFKGFFFSQKLQNEENIIDFFPTEVLLIILNFHFNTSYYSSFTMRTRSTVKVSS